MVHTHDCCSGAGACGGTVDDVDDGVAEDDDVEKRSAA